MYMSSYYFERESVGPNTAASASASAAPVIMNIFMSNLFGSKMRQMANVRVLLHIQSRVYYPLYVFFNLSS